MAEIEKTTIWKGERSCNVNTHELEPWLADGWSTSEPRAEAAAAPAAEIAPEQPAKRKRAKGAE